MSAGFMDMAGPDPAFKKMFLRAVGVSALAHLIFFCAVAVFGNFHPRPRFEADVINVKLYGPPPRPGRPGPPKQPAMTAPAPTPQEKPKPAAKPVIKPEPPKPKKEVALNKEIQKPAETKKPEPKPEAKPQPAVTSPPPEPLPPGSQEDIELARSMIHGENKEGEGGAGGSTVGDADWSATMEGMEGDVRLRMWAEQARVVLRDAWKYPPSIPVNTGLHVDVVVQVDRDGNIMSHQFYKLSGNPELDQSVERLFEQVKTLPPIPFLNPGESKKIGYSFAPGEEE
jgi:outer membrane biosynthesis protein TonB